METFGTRLQSEREDRGLTIESVAERVGVDRNSLLALERNDFESLPDHAWFVQMRLWEEAAKGERPFREDPLPEGVDTDTRPSREDTFRAAVSDCLALNPLKRVSAD